MRWLEITRLWAIGLKFRKYFSNGSWTRKTFRPFFKEWSQLKRCRSIRSLTWKTSTTVPAPAPAPTPAPAPAPAPDPVPTPTVLKKKKKMEAPTSEQGQGSEKLWRRFRKELKPYIFDDYTFEDYWSLSFGEAYDAINGDEFFNPQEREKLEKIWELKHLPVVDEDEDDWMMSSFICPSSNISFAVFLISKPISKKIRKCKN